jgi:predicted metalloprotease with PDZ domain
VSGVNLRAFFDRALRSTEDLPLGEVLADVGIEFGLRAAESDQDKGGKAGTRAQTVRPTLGVRLAEGGSDAKLATVYDGGAAQAAGLASGDVIIAVDGLRTTRGGLEELIGSYRPGATVCIHAFRRDELMTFDVTLRAAPVDTCFLALKDDAGKPTRSRRAAWLGRR